MVGQAPCQVLSGNLTGWGGGGVFGHKRVSEKCETVEDVDSGPENVGVYDFCNLRELLLHPHTLPQNQTQLHVAGAAWGPGVCNR